MKLKFTQNIKFVIVLLLFPIFSNAEIKVKIYYELTSNGYEIFADNDEFCPVSVKINFTTTNLSIEGGNNKTHVIDSKRKKQHLTTLTEIKKGKAYKFSFQSNSNYGSVLDKEFDIDYVYDLPYKTHENYTVSQGYNGTFSHQNENSLDFLMPIGTEITAVRDGIVINLIDNNNKNCPTKDCMKFNNVILIYHSDNTFAEYAHLKLKGAKVKVGDKITKGQVIGLSGNVGWSTAAHLHLVIFKQGIEKRETLKTKFKTNEATIEFLNENKNYFRKY
jgi:murein DD-endopeptidase MepM/ murein hydrolase activator NlpD